MSLIFEIMNRHIFLLLFCIVPHTFAFELITGASFLVGAALSYYYGKDTIKASVNIIDLAICSSRLQIYECCGKPWIDPVLPDLRVDLHNFLYGQHIVQQTIPAAIESSIDKLSPTKPLVISFHGQTGVGKNFVASFIARNFYKNGEKSKFYHYFNSRKDFPYQDNYHTYQEQLRSWIIGNVTLCPHSMFIFDEVDKMPIKILDGIKPFLDHHKSIAGVDYRRAIFIFISNIGSRVIMERYLELWRTEGKKREEMTMNDFDKIINRGAFNEQGGLQMSDIIDHNLIDLYVPFLPLEKSHIELCIRRTMKRMGYSKTDDIVEEVMKMMTFGPEPEALFAHSGCKRLDQQVRTLINIRKYHRNLDNTFRNAEV